MPDTVLVLGPVVFQDFEVPERINFGGAQRLAVHQLPGGARVIDTLGRDDADIIFSGTFTGADATLRARTLDELRALGTVQPLTWDVFTYSVVIRDFAANFDRAGWIPFRLTCTVLRDEAAALVEASLSLSTAILGDFSLAVAGVLASGIDLASAADALAAPGATQRGTAAYANAATRLAASRGAIAAGIAAAEAGLDPGALRTAASIGATASTLERLSTLTQIAALAGRAAVNLANAST